MIAAAWALSLLWILPVTGWSTMANTNSTRTNDLDSCDTEFADNITFKVSQSKLLLLYIIIVN